MTSCSVPQKDPGDHEPGDHEEDVDSYETSTRKGSPCVKENDEQYCNSSKALYIRSE